METDDGETISQLNNKKKPARADTDLTLVDDCSIPEELVQTSTTSTILSSDTSIPNKTVFHIYHRKLVKRHLVISPAIDTSRESCFHLPCFLKVRTGSTDKAAGIVEKLQEEAALSRGYFLHKPTLSFHHPPRSLRRGAHKHAPVVCLIHNSLLWRRWKLQFGDCLEEAVDPRGVVAEDYDSAANKKDDHALKGYKVRSWRLWDESGRDYHKQVNAERKDFKHGHRGSASRSKTSSDANSESDQKIFKPSTADEVVYLDWTSPFSQNTRRYHFHYRGLDFYWKGTGTVKESRKCGFLLHFHHLKLVVRVPLGTDDQDTISIGPSFKRIVSKKEKGEFAEICLATYASSLASRKAGQLELYDAAIYRLWAEYFKPREAAPEQSEVEKESPENAEQEKAEGVVDVSTVKKTRLYDLVVATAVCMLIGEWQKRETIKKVLEAAATEGAGSAGGS